ncbi:MAG: thioredoxin-dependent thiol peroxidase [Campylobacteraceae bacterium]|jgi:peroxiredoxin Q/BCP|nr:thioredoxin-dependent thiol peroxidase [Campylobacteraceae bacterium]
MLIEAGKTAPQFSLKNQDGIEISLKDLMGKWIVLYFYPKDNTPGCTTEACDFTAALPDFKKLDAVVIGISPDSVKSHQNFIQKQNITFTLLSDEQKDAAKAYDVWKLKKNYGKEYMGIERSTFLIDTEGKIAKIWRKVNVKGHGDEVKNVLMNLQKNP